MLQFRLTKLISTQSHCVIRDQITSHCFIHIRDGFDLDFFTLQIILRKVKFKNLKCYQYLNRVSMFSRFLLNISTYIRSSKNVVIKAHFIYSGVSERSRIQIRIAKVFWFNYYVVDHSVSVCSFPLLTAIRCLRYSISTTSIRSGSTAVTLISASGSSMYHNRLHD